MKLEFKIALTLAGMPQSAITDIENALPAMLRLLAAWKELEPHIMKLKPDLDKSVPVVEEIINFVKGN